MKVQIRRGVFETNSSSVHTLTMCTDSEYQSWKNGDLIWDTWDDKLVDAVKQDGNECRYKSIKDFYHSDFETFHSEYTTPSGEVVHAFGYFGYDG